MTGKNNDPRIAYVPMPKHIEGSDHDHTQCVEWAQDHHVVVMRPAHTVLLQDTLDEAAGLLRDLRMNYYGDEDQRIASTPIIWNCVDVSGATYWIAEFRYTRVSMPTGSGGGGGLFPPEFMQNLNTQGFLQTALNKTPGDPFSEKN